MDRLTYRDDTGRALLTLYGKQMYCSTQATADCFAKLEESIPRWISVEERLPKPGERVLAAMDDFVAEAFVNKSGVWMRNGFELDWWPPDHWMPLPEPPKEGGGED